MPNENILPTGDVVQSDGAPVAAPEPAPAPVVPPEATVGATLQTSPEPAPKEKASLIPKSRLDKEIQKRKEAERQLQELQQAVLDADEDGVTVPEGEHSMQEIEELIESKLAPLTAREREAQLSKVFSENYSRAIDAMPEYKNIANSSVIQQLALNPANANKTYSQLIEETYGNAIQGRRTIETATPRGGGKPEALDVARAARDTEYFKEVMADPTLKAQYNATLTSRLRL